MGQKQLTKEKSSQNFYLEIKISSNFCHENAPILGLSTNVILNVTNMGLSIQIKYIVHNCGSLTKITSNVPNLGSSTRTRSQENPRSISNWRIRTVQSPIGGLGQYSLKLEDQDSIVSNQRISALQYRLKPTGGLGQSSLKTEERECMVLSSD